MWRGCGQLNLVLQRGVDAACWDGLLAAPPSVCGDGMPAARAMRRFSGGVLLNTWRRGAEYSAVG